MKDRGVRADTARAAERGTGELSARHRRALGRGVLASVVLHLVLLLAALLADPEPPSPFAAAGPHAGDDRAALGGGMEAVQLRTPPPPPEIAPPPEPVPVPELALEVEPEPEPEPEPIDFAELAGTVAEEAAGDPGPEQGPGLETGAGEGDGGTEDEGRFRVVPPAPRGLILPPSDRPGRVRGTEVTVWVYVSEEGRVVPDSTQIRPSTGDRRFDDRLRRQAAEWVFEPARRHGQAIAEWFQYVITL